MAMFMLLFGLLAGSFTFVFLDPILVMPDISGDRVAPTIVYYVVAFVFGLLKYMISFTVACFSGLAGYGVDVFLWSIVRRAWIWLTLADIPSREYRAFYKQAEEEFDSDQRVASVYKTAQLSAVFDDAKTKRFYCEARATDLTARASARQSASNT